MRLGLRVSASFAAALLGLGLLLAALLYWAMALRQPLPAAPQAASGPAAADPAAQALAQWFGPGEVRMDVEVSGLLRSAGQAVAVMAVNGQPPRTYRVGDEVAQSATVAAIEGDAVLVRRDGQLVRYRVPAPRGADADQDGIVRRP
ncbi:type II secretion system protein N [Orrella sp. JC864]|uniref:type II secretion system protein N n=1 Tax=Orrella sp. JC864 TaxID=3120298 RepID=UPI003009B7CE